MKEIDLRSDTVTHPTNSMRSAMANAELGDDGHGDDPTVNHLQERVADMMGKESALFVPSGTMANLVAILSHCERGDEIIVGDWSHVYLYEYGGASSLGGLIYRQVETSRDGTLDPGKIEDAIRPSSPRFPKTSLVCLENSHNRCSGAVLTASYTESIADIAHRNGASVHVDGARLFNAAIAQELSPRDLISSVDSAMFCFSKGLCCPVGSIIVGEREFIGKARRFRNTLGGGMRQVGVLAAAALVALDEMVDRLIEDHNNARTLAEGLSNIKGIALDLEVIETNIVYFEVFGHDVPALLAKFEQRGLRASRPYGNNVRMVTHYGISKNDVFDALRIVESVMADN